MTVINRVIFW